MAKDLIGPGAFGASNAVTARPAVAPDNTTGASDTWFKNCSSATSRDGTTIEEGYLNFLLAQIRRAIRGMGIAESNVDDDMLLKAIQAASSGGEFPAHTHAQSDVINLVADLSAINAAIAGKVAKAGDMMTGALRLAQGLPYEITTDGTGFFFKDVTNTRYPVKFLAGSYDNALVIDASGNVGLNTASPAEKFHVVGKALATEGYKVNAAGQPSMIKPGQGDGASATLCNLVIDSWWGVGFANTLPAAGVPVGENGAWIDVRNGDVGYRSALMPNGDVGTTGKVLTGGRPNTWKLPSEIWGRKIVAVGRATGASAAITFASAEPDTSYEVAGYGGWGGSGDNSGGTSTNLSLSSKSAGGCTVNLNDEGGGAPTGSVRFFYIIFRNA